MCSTISIACTFCFPTYYKTQLLYITKIFVCGGLCLSHILERPGRAIILDLSPYIIEKFWTWAAPGIVCSNLHVDKTNPPSSLSYVVMTRGVSWKSYQLQWYRSPGHVCEPCQVERSLIFKVSMTRIPATYHWRERKSCDSLELIDGWVLTKEWPIS